MIRFCFNCDTQLIRLRSIAAGVAILHIVSGLIILDDGNASNPTPLALLTFITGGHIPTTAIILILIGVMALLPFAFSIHRPWIVACIAPQQIILGFHLASALSAITLGRYPDGYIPAGNSHFIAVDQIWLIMVVLWHSLEFRHLIPRKHHG